MLETRNINVLNLLDELRQFKGTASLIRQIEDFEFAAALKTIEWLR